MLETLGNVSSTLLEHWLNSKHKPYVSVLLYYISGIIGGICVISNCVPYRCSLEFIESIVIREDLNDSQLIIQVAIWMIIIQIIHSAIQNLLLNKFEVTIYNHKWFTHLFTIGDMSDLLCSFTSFLFMTNVFIQMYHTGSIYQSCKAAVIYLWITYKFFTLIYVRYANKNVEIISNVIKRNP